MSRLASSAQPIHICFYSNRCDWCKAFITELAQTPYKGEFRFVCVDPSPTRPTLPSWLKKVPTLVINGEPEPRTDNEVLNWLYERKMKDGGGSRTGGTASAAVGELEPEPYMDTEMGGGYGDSYSFLDMDTSTGGNGGLSISHNFSYLGDGAPAGGAGVGTREGSSFQTTDMSGKRSKKEEMLDKQMDAYMKSRDSGVPKGPARM